MSTPINGLNNVNSMLINSNSVTNNTAEDTKDTMFNMMYQMVLDSMLSSSADGMGIGSSLAYSLNGQTSSSGLASSLNTIGEYNSNRINYGSYSNNKSQQAINGSDFDLGKLSAEYESNGDAGSISYNSGDIGGKSYGIWQLASNTGSLNSFMNWLKNNNSSVYSSLENAKLQDGNSFGNNFDSAWKSVADKSSKEFGNLQFNYIKQNYYDAAAERIYKSTGVNINTKSDALKNVLWSAAVQHGAQGAANIFSKINLKDTDSNIISNVYNERQKVNLYFRDSSQAVKNSVYNRFAEEKNQALSMLGQNEV
ncbi:vgrg protein [Clostridium sp. 19966]|uniref:VgrG-related protein n=1 Tax=Clostridium sp. 19966 TaxID=2768166 RepID=UPI0028DF9C05|nr:vgrg protein [Clostridium sp. 19966]MDT8717904.1 vgrg protein [Clostridium sp. 19966]